MFWIKLMYGSGHIREAINEAKKLSKKLGMGIEFDFNGITMFITKNSNTEEQEAYYNNQLNKGK